MRAWHGGILAAAIVLAPLAGAEFGELGSDGWPRDVDGRSTNPFPGVSIDEFNRALATGDPLNQVAGITVYPYWPLLTAEVTRMAREHPDLVRLTSAGKSTLGLDLYMLEICNFAEVTTASPLHSGNNCPAPDGTTREVIWVDGGTHSNEYSGVYFTLAWAQFLVEQYGKNETATWIVQNRHTWVMPLLNADGSHAMGRLNANGVNINRNFPVVWDGAGHDPLLNNRGPSPASEVETKIAIEWYNKTRADYGASVHCCGNLWLYPYGEKGIDPVDNPMLSRVCEEAFPAVRDDCGPIWSTIYPASGSSVDTAYEFSGTVAFGYEMSGRGSVSLWGQPLTFQEVRTQEIESWTGLEHAARNVHLYGAYPAVTAVRDDGKSLHVTIRNDGYGNLSRAAVEASYAPNVHLADWDGVAVPFLQPGESATVQVPRHKAKVNEGEHFVLALHYVKRLVPTSNEGLRLIPLVYAAEGQATGPEGALVVTQEKAPEASTPAVPTAVLVAALAAMAIFVRRRA